MLRPTGRHPLPEFHERTSYGSRTLDPYSKLLEERVVFIGTELDDTVANDVIAQLLYLEHTAPERDISVYLNSPGGSFTAMTSIYDAMCYVGPDIETVCLGQVASAAAVLLAAGTPGKRLALPGSRVLIRQPELEQAIEGSPADLAVQAAEMERTRRTLETMLARHTGQDTARIHRDIEHALVLTAEEAVGYGLVDRVTHPRKRATQRAGERR